MLGNRPSAMQLLSQTHGTPRKMRSGGAVHGPGTGTSDSIPALLSNGEYVLPADTVATVGRPALDALRSLTHTPVQKFADGGLVDNPYGAVTRSGNSYSGMDVRGNISVNGSAPNGTYTENPAGRAAAAMSSLPAAAPAPAPSPVSAPAVSTGVSPTPAAQPGAAAAPMGWEQRNAMRNNAVTASSMVASPERDAARATLMGVMPGQTPTPGVPAPATSPVPGSAASQLATVPARRPLQYQGGSVQRYANGGLVGEEEPSGPLTRSTAVLAAQQPAQMSAQQVLSALPQAQAPAIRHSGNDWQARKDLANLQTAASSITNDRRWGGQGDRSDDRQAYQRALATDLALKGSAPEMEQAAMRENGANARAALADLGSTQRTSMEQAGAGARAQLADMGSTYRTNIEQSGAGARALLSDTGAFRRQELENQGALDRQALQSAGTVQAAQIKATQTLNKENQQQTKDTQDIFSIIGQARPLIDKATSSTVGNAVDGALKAFGWSTPGANAAAQLKALEGSLVSKMPKMSGPQSDKDVQLYKDMAGQIGNPSIPAEQRKAAMDTIEELNLKYLPSVADDAGYQALASGAYYRAPNGAVLRKK